MVHREGEPPYGGNQEPEKRRRRHEKVSSPEVRLATMKQEFLMAEENNPEAFRRAINVLGQVMQRENATGEEIFEAAHSKSVWRWKKRRLKLRGEEYIDDNISVDPLEGEVEDSAQFKNAVKAKKQEYKDALAEVLEALYLYEGPHL